MKVALNEVAAVILAGGFGTRIRHLLRDLPKPMAPVAGRPFVEWVVRYLAHQGVTRVVLSTGYLAEVIADHFSAHPIPGVSVTCVPETTPLGTGGGVLHAARNAGGNPPAAWLILNGDSLVFADLSQAVQALAEPSVAGVILGRQIEDASRYGTLATDASGNLLSFQEKRPGSGVINTGIYLLRHELLDEFPAPRPLSIEQDVFPSLIQRGRRLQVVPTEAPFLDIGTPESLPQADAFISGNQSHFLI